MHQAYKLTKRTKRALRKQGVTVDNSSLNNITPLTKNQERIFNGYNSGKNMFLFGTAGTGKTYLALYLMLRDVLNGKYDKLVIMRSVVPSRDMGFLPGDQHEKLESYEMPYYELCYKLFNRKDAYDILKKENLIEFMSTSFIRGITFENTAILVDECQNMNWGELSTVMTRVGEYSRISFCGDTKQSDLRERDGKNDLLKLMRVCKIMDEFDFIQMDSDDIVRSNFQKQFIIKCEELGY